MRSIQTTIDAVTLHRPWLQHISGDLFGISERIRRIDPGYFIVRNKVRNVFEVHHVDRYPLTFEFTVPFDALDARTLEHCRKTMVQNTEKLIAELDAHNAKIDADKKRNISNDIESIALETASDLRRAYDQ